MIFRTCRDRQSMRYAFEGWVELIWELLFLRLVSISRGIQLLDSIRLDQVS